MQSGDPEFSEVTTHMTQSEKEKRQAREAHQFEKANQELFEAHILVPAWDVEKFLAFCQEQLGQMPSLSRAGTVSAANGASASTVGEAVATARTPKRRTPRAA